MTQGELGSWIIWFSNINYVVSTYELTLRRRGWAVKNKKSQSPKHFTHFTGSALLFVTLMPASWPAHVRKIATFIKNEGKSGSCGLLLYVQQEMGRGNGKWSCINFHSINQTLDLNAGLEVLQHCCASTARWCWAFSAGRAYGSFEEGTWNLESAILGL